MSSPLLARIAELQERNDELAAEVAHLRSTLETDFRIWIPGVRMTKREAAVFGVLMKREIATRVAIMMNLYGDDDWAEMKIIDVFICKIRRKLLPYGIRIICIWGVGYQLSTAAKRAVEAGEVRLTDDLPQDFPPELVEPMAPQPAASERRVLKPTARKGTPKFLWGAKAWGRA